MIHHGDLTCPAHNKDYCDTVTEITGNAYAYIKGAFPMVTSVGCNAYAYAFAEGAFPLLTSVGGHAYAYADGAFASMPPTTIRRWK